MKVEFKGTLTSRHTHLFLDLASRKNGSFTLPFYVLALITFAISLISFVWGIIGAICWFLLSLMLLNSWRMQRQAQKLFLGDQTEHEIIDTTGFITEEGIEYRIGTSNHMWSGFTGYGLSENYIVIFDKNGQGYQFSAEFFTSKTDWDTFLELVGRNLTKSHGTATIENGQQVHAPDVDRAGDS